MKQIFGETQPKINDRKYLNNMHIEEFIDSFDLDVKKLSKVGFKKTCSYIKKI